MMAGVFLDGRLNTKSIRKANRVQLWRIEEYECDSSAAVVKYCNKNARRRNSQARPDTRYPAWNMGSNPNAE